MQEFINQFPREFQPIVVQLILIWSVAWKGIALWHAAKRNEKIWYVALLLINTLGLLEIGYLALKVKLFNNLSLRAPKFAASISKRIKRVKK